MVPTCWVHCGQLDHNSIRQMCVRSPKRLAFNPSLWLHISLGTCVLWSLSILWHLAFDHVGFRGNYWHLDKNNSRAKNILMSRPLCQNCHVAAVVRGGRFSSTTNKTLQKLIQNAHRRNRFSSRANNNIANTDTKCTSEEPLLIQSQQPHCKN